jgi:hypothetical protein
MEVHIASKHALTCLERVATRWLQRNAQQAAAGAVKSQNKRWFKQAYYQSPTLSLSVEQECNPTSSLTVARMLAAMNQPSHLCPVAPQYVGGTLVRAVSRVRRIVAAISQ